MPNRSYKICNTPGCNELTTERYCSACKEKHDKREQKYWDKRRGTARERGYDSKWNKQSKVFRDNPDNQFCYIQGPNCTGLAQCTDHINPPADRNDPLFKDSNNRAPACIHCNSWKGHRSIQQLVNDEKEYYNRLGYNPIEWLKERGLNFDSKRIKS